MFGVEDGAIKKVGGKIKSSDLDMVIDMGDILFN